MIPTHYLRACISTPESDYKSTRLALDEVKTGLYFALIKANKDVRLYLDDVKLRHACQCLEQSDWEKLLFWRGSAPCEQQSGKVQSRV